MNPDEKEKLGRLLKFASLIILIASIIYLLIPNFNSGVGDVDKISLMVKGESCCVPTPEGKICFIYSGKVSRDRFVINKKDYDSIYSVTYLVSETFLLFSENDKFAILELIDVTEDVLEVTFSHYIQDVRLYLGAKWELENEEKGVEDVVPEENPLTDVSY